MKKITKLQAFNAVGRLLQMYFDDKPSGSLATILGGMGFLDNKEVVDDGMWEIWNKSLNKILQHKNLRNYDHLSVLQAFLVMGSFLEGFFGTNDLDDDIDFLECNARKAFNKEVVDQALWKKWLQCVDEVLSVKDSRAYFYLLPKD